MATKTIKIYALTENNTTNNYVQMGSITGSWQTGRNKDYCYTAQNYYIRMTYLKSDFSDYLNSVVSAKIVFSGEPGGTNHTQSLKGYLNDAKRAPTNVTNSNYLIHSFSFLEIFEKNIEEQDVTYTFSNSNLNFLKNWLNSNNTNYSYLVVHAPDNTNPLIYFRNCYIELTYEEAEATIPVSSITLNPTSLTLTIGKTETINATVSPDNATNKELSWSSNKTSVATVDSNGKVTAVSAGSARITCTARDGSGISAYCDVTVNKQEILITSIRLNKTETTLFIGETETLTATIFPNDATNKNLLWESSDSNIASVDQNGKIIAKSKGNVTITCSAQDGSGITASCNVTVFIEKIEISPTDIVEEVGEIIIISAKITVSPTVSEKPTWQFNSSYLEKVSESINGTVYSISFKTLKIIDSTIVTCSINGSSGLLSATTEVSIIPSVNYVTGISISPDSSTLKLGEAQTFTVTIEPSNASNKAFSWFINEAEGEEYLSISGNTFTVIKEPTDSDKTFTINAITEENNFWSNDATITILKAEIKNQVYVYIGGKYRPAKAYIYNGGWKECSSVWIYNGGWKQTKIV